LGCGNICGSYCKWLPAVPIDVAIKRCKKHYEQVQIGHILSATFNGRGRTINSCHGAV